MIRGSTVDLCEQMLQRQITGYLDRLEQRAAHAEQAVQVQRPAIYRDGGDRLIVSLPREGLERVRMTSATEIEELFARESHRGILLGARPSLLFGRQIFAIVKETEGGHSLRTVEYCYHFFTRASRSNEAWYGLRVENSAENSWFLNHPLHHIQLGMDKALRLRSVEAHSFAGFVDLILRHTASPIWARMYPDLHDVLNEKEGPFQKLAQGRARHARGLESVFREARAEPLPWYIDWMQWLDDIQECDREPDFIEIFDAAFRAP
jgi:hypothetical protein